MDNLILLLAFLLLFLGALLAGAGIAAVVARPHGRNRADWP